jgi:hypothetical protein
MKPQVRNRVTMLGGEVAAEVAASTPDRRAWMMIRAGEDGGFMLVEFEHAADLDTDGWFAPEDVLDRQRTDFQSLDDLLDTLASRGVDTEVFDAPWKTGYPL